MNFKKISKKYTISIITFVSPFLSHGALLFQYDFNNGVGESTLDTTFPDDPALTGTQKIDTDPVTFSDDVPNAHNGGFSGAHHKGTGTNEVALKFVLPTTTKNIGPITLSAWLKPDVAATGTMTYFQTGSTFRVQRLNETTVRFRYGDQNMDGTAALPLDTWTYIAITYNGDITTFYTRSETASEFTINTVDGNNDLTSGGGVNIFTSHSASVSQGWDGLMDNLRLYDNALTEEEIDLIYRSTDVFIPEASYFSFMLGMLGIALGIRKKFYKHNNYS